MNEKKNPGQYIMDYAIEAIIFVIMVFIVIGRPEGIMTVGNTLIGRALMIALIVCLALKSTVGGLLGALLLVVVSESLIEGMDTGKGKKGKDEDEKDKDGKDKDGKDKDGKDKEGKAKDEKDEKDKDEKDEGKNGKDEGGKHAGKEDDHEKDDDHKSGKDGFSVHKEELTKLIGGTDLVGLTERFSKLRSLADAINRSQ